MRSSFEINDYVSIDGSLTGFVQYCDNDVVGVRLIGKSMGDSDGTFQGKRRFVCQPQSAMFVDPSRITKLYMKKVERLKAKRDLAASIHYTMKHNQQQRTNPLVDAGNIEEKEKGYKPHNADEFCASQELKMETIEKRLTEQNLQFLQGFLESSEIESREESRKERSELSAFTEDRELPEQREPERISKHNHSAPNALIKRIEQLEIDIENKKKTRAKEVEQRIHQQESFFLEPNEELALIRKYQSEHLFTIALKEKQQQVDELQQKLVEAEATNSELMVHVSSIEESNMILKAFVKSLECTQKDDIEKLEKAFENSNTFNSELQSRVSQLKQKRKEEVEQLLILRAVSESENVNTDLHNRIEESKQRSLKMEKLKKYLLDCQSLQNQVLDQIKSEKQKDNEEEKGTERDQGHGKVEHFEKLIKTLNENQASSKQASASQPRNTSLISQANNLEKFLSEANHSNKTLRDRIEILEQQNKQLESRVIELKESERQHEKEKKEVKDLKKFLSFAKFMNQELKGKATKAEEEKQVQYSKLEKALLISQTAQTKFKERAETLEQQNRKLQNSSNNQKDLQKSLNESQEALSKSETAQLKLKERAARLQQQKLELEASFHTEKDRSQRALQKSLDESRKQNRGLKKVIAKMQEERKQQMKRDSIPRYQV